MRREKYAYKLTSKNEDAVFYAKTYSSVYPWLFSLGFFMASQGITFVVVS
jgi:uncharacterized membrane protein